MKTATGAESGSRRSPLPHALFAQVQFFDDGAVALDIGLLEVTQQVASVADHLQHATATVMVFVVGLEVLGQGVDAIRQNGDLHLGGTGVALMGLELLDNGLLFFLLHGLFTFLLLCAYAAAGG